MVGGEGGGVGWAAGAVLESRVLQLESVEQCVPPPAGSQVLEVPGASTGRASSPAKPHSRPRAALGMAVPVSRSRPAHCVGLGFTGWDIRKSREQSQGRAV